MTTPKIVVEVPVFGSLDLGEHRFDKFATFLPENSAHFPDQTIPHQVVSESNAGNRHDDQKDRGQGRDRVKGNCRASTQSLAILPRIADLRIFHTSDMACSRTCVVGSPRMLKS